MESKRKKQAGLLPRYFKNIGLAVIILAIVAVIITRAMKVELTPSQKETFSVFILNAFILGLLLVSWARDKVEDEMTVFLRLKTIAWTFTWAVLYVIIAPFIDLLVKDPVTHLTGQQVVMSMLFIYLISYYLQKAGR